MTDAPTILIDCDGVIVDNLDFEQCVTKTIVANYARHEGISIDAATTAWSAELSATRGSNYWYDYAFHATRLGLDGIKISRHAHYVARNLLRLVSGADVTLGLLQEYGLQACIVTDATRWVVDFKLSSLGVNEVLSVFSSTEAAATKADPEYWLKLTERHPSLEPKALIDNRKVNLSTADRQIRLPYLVQFDKEEHVMTLSTTEAPSSEGLGQEYIHVVRNHDELQTWLKASIFDL